MLRSSRGNNFELRIGKEHFIGGHILRTIYVMAHDQPQVTGHLLAARGAADTLSPEAESGGQGGSGTQVGGTTVLDAAHAEAVSGHRSHRE